MKLRLISFQKNTTNVLCSVWFRCSGVFCWFYVDVLLVFWSVLLVFQVIPLFHHCSGVFLCSVVPWCSAGVLCSGVPGFIVCLLFLLYSNVHKKNSVLKILLWREMDNVTFSFLISLVKIWSEGSILIPIPIHPVLFWGRGRSRGGEGGTDEHPVSDKPPLIRCGETYSTWRL